MEPDWYSIKQEITSSLVDSGFRVYVSIADAYGNIKIIDSQLEPYEDIIKHSIHINREFLGIGDYAIPLSSKNLMIFKISKNSIVVLFANKGNIAQLLSFKKNIKYFAGKIDQFMGDIEVEVPKLPKVIPLPEVKKVEKKVAKPIKQILGKEMPMYYPFLNKKIGDKIKAKVEEIHILHLCDGQHSFSDIMDLTKQPIAFVFDFLSKQIKTKVVSTDAYPFFLECPDCNSQHHLFILKNLLKTAEDPFKLLVRAEICNHEYVAFINKKLKVETQSFKYFTDFQKDKFMKRLGGHYYTILS
ncbi:MAG: hypothetical protein HWN65_12605 [Candidatus Helarchaeota archaeon]|nr:hypothetical protein [Candidatus Helarchaeota archaeon]